jgi:NhaA family Na+:H+ antiporter
MPCAIPDQAIMPRKTHLANRLAAAVLRAIHGEAGFGVILMLAAAAAMLTANSALHHGYHAFFHDTLPWTPIARLSNLHGWINDALMAIFFFAVGLEIKREVLDGELSTPERRRLPIVAAIAGMATPAAIYLAIAGGDPALHRGWAIPAATDIAFAIGVLALLGKRIPPALRLFLLTVAIVDDLGSVLIIALVFTSGIEPGWLVAGFAVLGLMLALNRIGATSGWLYGPLAVCLWYFVLHSGVHATVAGVLAALTIPLRPGRLGNSLLLRMEHALLPLNGYVIVPLFGFANAGVSLAGIGLSALAGPLPLAIAAGLVVGKQAGIFGAIFLAERSGFAPRPGGTSWAQAWGVAVLCGVGFTMSLFMAALAFPEHPALVEAAKLGVLLGSLVSGVLGYAILRMAAGKTG